MNRACGVTEPGTTSTWPRRTSSRVRRAAGSPRCHRPGRRPASCRTTPCRWPPRPRSPSPTTSTGVADRNTPRSTAPVTTVPRPLMVSTLSIGIRNGSSTRARAAARSRRRRRAGRDGRDQRGSPSNAPAPRRATTGTSSPGKPYSESSSRTSSSTRSSSSGSSTRSHVLGDHAVGHPDASREQHVLAGLRHGAVLRGDHQDRGVDLGRAGDHVLHVVGVAGHVDVGVVTGGRLVLHVRDVDGDPALDLLGRAVDAGERHEPVGGGSASARTLVIAAVRVVFPWSTWPMVPMLRWGLVRTNWLLAMAVLASLAELGAGPLTPPRRRDDPPPRPCFCRR